MYEPRIGDLVTAVSHPGETLTVRRLDEAGPVLGREGRAGRIYGHRPGDLTPLRPDAPGQRVRAPDCTRGVTESTLDGRDCFVVAWNGWRSTWPADRLIRIADQAPAAPVEAPRPETPAEAGAAMYAALVAPGPALLDAAAAQWAAPEYAPTGPTCQHCGSGIVAGLLRDTCPRGCDLTLRAAEPEPEIVGTLPWTYANMDAGAPMPSLASSREPVWTAAGRGVAASHPTREGAIVAWREAVRAKEGSRP